MVWDNLRKILLVNTPINNAQGMSVLFGLALGLKQTPLTSIQVLYSNLICAITLGFVCAIGEFLFCMMVNAIPFDLLTLTSFRKNLLRTVSWTFRHDVSESD